MSFSFMDEPDYEMNTIEFLATLVSLCKNADATTGGPTPDRAKVSAEHRRPPRSRSSLRRSDLAQPNPRCLATESASPAFGFEA